MFAKRMERVTASPIMNSQGHRENLLDRNWRRIGIGIHCDSRGRFWVTQMFSD